MKEKLTALRDAIRQRLPFREACLMAGIFTLPLIILNQYVFLGFTPLFLWFCFWCWFINKSICFRNNRKLYLFIGAKGSGKSTVLTKLAIRHIKEGRKVFSNMYVPGAYLFDPKQLGTFDFPENSVIFCDEAGTIWDNRNFKSFTDGQRDYFKYQRQFKHTVYLFSQSFDIDKKLRDLTDSIYIVRCYFNIISVATRVRKVISVISASDSGVGSQGESKIVDDFVIEPFTMALWGSRIFTWIPSWVKFFNSFNPPWTGVPASPELCPVPEGLFDTPLQKLKKKIKGKLRNKPASE